MGTSHVPLSWDNVSQALKSNQVKNHPTLDTRPPNSKQANAYCNILAGFSVSVVLLDNLIEQHK